MRGGADGERVDVVEAMLRLDHPRKMEFAAWAEREIGAPSDTFDRSAWRRAADAGVLRVIAPAPYGDERSAVEAMLTFEGLGLGSANNGLVLALGAQVFAVQTALARFGRPDQLDRWLAPMCEGSAIGSFAMSEPEAGSHTASISTTATESGSGYVIDGTKTWVTLAPEADMAIVFATVDPSLGRWGITAFLVPLDTPGVHVGEVVTKMGLRSCPFSEIVFDGCQVGEDAVLGGPRAGGSVFSFAVEAERAFLYAAQLGATERTMTAAVERARSREQGGRPIGAHQGVAYRIADMKLRHEQARLLVYKAAALYDRGEPVAMAAALAKLATSEGAVQTAIDAVQTFGAFGYTDGAGIEREVRDSIGGLAYSGTSEIQRNIVASILGVDRPRRREPGAR